MAIVTHATLLVILVTMHKCAGETLDDVDKRVPTYGFQGVRGKKIFYVDGAELKRVPMDGFMGMRGKKQMDAFDARFSYDIPKRLGNYGFVGMRGKKPDAASNKREPNYGFVGMRGKKAQYQGEEAFDEDIFGAIKRGTLQFYGMRGKKTASNRVFNLHGRKRPFELRSAFMGVRGKKSDANQVDAD